MLNGIVLATLLAVTVLTTGMALGLGDSGPRTVEIVQVGKGFTIKCSTDRGVYPYYSEVAKTVEEALEQTKHCLTTKIKPEWGN